MYGGTPEFSWDGTVLESSIDGGITWQQVGAFGDPDNWYNNDDIDGLSAAGSTGNGWTGTVFTGTGSGDYVEAIHLLNGLAGEPSVTLRVAFGSDGSVVDDGFAFDNVRIDVPVPPVVVIDTFPYQESFEGGDGGWTTSGTLWELGTPAGVVIIGASDGTNAWATDLDDFYTNNAFETVVSPIFDFTGFTDDPEFRMDAWWNSEFSWDGTVLESSIDGGITWQQVGALWRSRQLV